MTYTRKNVGVCSEQTVVELDENGVIRQIEVEDGCDGNLKGLCIMLQGVPAAEAATRLEGITCGNKTTSCPAQIAQCLREALQQ